MRERERFEKWYEAYKMPSESDWFRAEDGEYVYSFTQEAWEAWQASAREQAEKDANLVERLIDQTYADAEGAAAKNAFMYAATYLRQHAGEREAGTPQEKK